MTRATDRWLERLERLRDVHGSSATTEKIGLLRRLARQRLAGADAVRRLHEALCWCRAYPDTPALLARVERELGRFARRADVRRFRDDLQNSGIGGTDIVYPFNVWTASWLARRWPERLSIEWQSVEDRGRLERLLMALALAAEVPGLDEAPLAAPSWARRLAGRRRSDAAFVVGRVMALAAPEDVKARLYDDLDLPVRLAAGAGTPARTTARFERSATRWQRDPMRAARPNLVLEARRPPRAIGPVSPADAERLVNLAHEAMVTRERDLDAFAWADAADVRMADCGEGLQFACIGVRPEKRFLLESVYGVLTLMNGVPIGYALASGLFESAEVAFNVFETFRGGEAAHVYGRFLALVRALFRCDTFSVPPYQLGDGNEEGIESGAWWFYYKLGLRPWAASIRPLVTREANRAARDRMYRSSRAVLRRLVRHPLFLSLGPRRRDVIGWRRFDRVGLAVSDYLAARFGDDRERASAVLADEAASRLGVAAWRRLPPGERTAWRQWAPLVAVLPGLEGWPDGDRRALARIIRAKGSRRESAFVPLFDAHPRLRSAVLSLAAGR